MHEFTSISVSSYDAASLADKLTEKSGAGWDVVAIVPAGTNITAYLRREAIAGGPALTWDTSEAARADDGGSAVTTPAFGTAAVEAEPEPAPEPEPEPEPIADAPTPVAEPAGWAIAPEPASPPTAAPEEQAISGFGVGTTTGEVAEVPATGGGGTTSGTITGEVAAEPFLGSTEPDTGAPAGPDAGSTAGSGDDATSTGTTTDFGVEWANLGTEETPAATTGYETGVTSGYEPVTTGGTTGTGYQAESAGASVDAAEEPAEEPAAPSAAPAGWYADPSGRYELRYWDGNQWTEHVSRAGQQYTDPPVA